MAAPRPICGRGSTTRESEEVSGGCQTLSAGASCACCLLLCSGSSWSRLVPRMSLWLWCRGRSTRRRRESKNRAPRCRTPPDSAKAARASRRARVAISSTRHRPPRPHSAPQTPSRFRCPLRSCLRLPSRCSPRSGNTRRNNSNRRSANRHHQTKENREAIPHAPPTMPAGGYGVLLLKRWLVLVACLRLFSGASCAALPPFPLGFRSAAL